MSEQKKFAVFGNPIKQSKSPSIHSLFAEQFGLQIQYRAVRVELDAFVQAATNFFEGGGTGLNVTVPFKGEAFDYADRLSDRALRAGAVNTLSRGDDGAGDSAVDAKPEDDLRPGLDVHRGAPINRRPSSRSALGRPAGRTTPGSRAGTRR